MDSVLPFDASSEVSVFREESLALAGAGGRAKRIKKVHLVFAVFVVGNIASCFCFLVVYSRISVISSYSWWALTALHVECQMAN